jgi:hypothetical protein
MERFEVPPERLGPWLERWAAANGPVLRTEDGVCFVATEAEVRCSPTFPLTGVATVEGFAPEALLAHVAQPRRVGVLLVRLGGAAAGVFEGRELVAHKVETRLVHGRHRKGGSSARRFERRRAGQARVALNAAAEAAIRVLVPVVETLDAVVLGGDRRALATVMDDRRLSGVAALAVERVIEVAEPRWDVLRASPDVFLSTVVSTRNTEEER